MLVLSLLLVAAIAAVYLPVRSFDFCGFDDDAYVSENPVVRQGLTLRGAAWAFTTFQVANWHPLTWLSHMADVSLFGLDPGAHHLVNAAFHAANAVLLFLVLRGMTGALWASAGAAALFALHPLRVESVAWIAQRKDVLCAFFFLLMLSAYLRYARSPSRGRLAAVTTLFAAGLLAKPMLVTAPFVLLLLDYWPLGRLGGPYPAPGTLSAGHPPPVAVLRALVEKGPLFLLSALSVAATLVAQSRGGALVPPAALPLGPRVSNAVVACAAYLWKTVWPAGLAVYYPHPGGALPAWKVAGAALLLAGLTGVAVREARRRPYLAVGWFWFLGMLVPVIGLVQVGGQAMADRYTYLPLVGVIVAAVWGLSEAAGGHRWRTVAAGSAAVLAVAAFAVAARVQTGYWKDGVTLFSRAIRVTENNAFSHLKLGVALSRKGLHEEAFLHFDQVLRIPPDPALERNRVTWHVAFLLALKGESSRHAGGFSTVGESPTPEETPGGSETSESLVRRGIHLAEGGNIDEGIALFREALRIRPDQPVAHVSLGVALAQKGKRPEAISHFETAFRVAPDFLLARYNLGIALREEGRNAEALVHFQEILKVNPTDAGAHYQLGSIYKDQGKRDQAVLHLRYALLFDPTHGAALEALREVGDVR